MNLKQTYAIWDRRIWRNNMVSNFLTTAIKNKYYKIINIYDEKMGNSVYTRKLFTISVVLFAAAYYFYH